MNKYKQTKQCELCLYFIIGTLFFMVMAYITPTVDREIIRNFMGALTGFASIMGVIVCCYIGYFLAKDHSDLGRRLISVYVMTGFIFACTAGMGIAGAVNPSQEIWDIIYNTRALAVSLEVVAVIRFVYTWVKLAKPDEAS